MKSNATTNLLLSIIAIALTAIAVRPFLEPKAAEAQSSNAQFYIEPGTYMLVAPDASRQLYGKVVVDLRNGKVWGFPTMGQQPYPFNAVESKPQTSHPFQLGRFALEETDK